MGDMNISNNKITDFFFNTYTLTPLFHLFPPAQPRRYRANDHAGMRGVRVVLIIAGDEYTKKQTVG